MTILDPHTNVYLRGTAHVVTSTDLVEVDVADAITLLANPAWWADLVIRLVESEAFTADELTDIIATSQAERAAQEAAK